MQDGVHSIRSFSLLELIEKHSFVEMIFLLLRGDMPSEKERVGNDMHTAIAAGILATGKRHGGAVQEAARVFSLEKSPQEIVASYQEEGKMIPGFGHKVYKEEDPRATAIYKKAQTLQLPTTVFDRAYALEAHLREQKRKTIPLNIDGAIAAALLTLKFDERVGDALFILPRMVGMTAHILEEYMQNNSYYRLSADDVEES